MVSWKTVEWDRISWCSDKGNITTTLSEGLLEALTKIRKKKGCYFSHLLGTPHPLGTWTKL